MSKDDSILSGITSADKPTLMRVLTNIVETQKNVAQQFNGLFSSINDSKNETKRAVDSLTDEMRRMELRTEKMVVQITSAHTSERAQLHAQIAQLVSQQDSLMALVKSQQSHCASIHNAHMNSQYYRPPPVQQPPAAMQTAYNNALPPNAMFGAPAPQPTSVQNELFNDILNPAQLAALQQQMRQFQQAQQNQAARAVASMTAIVPPAPQASTVPAATPSVATPTPANNNISFINKPATAPSPLVNAVKTEEKPSLMPTPPESSVSSSSSGVTVKPALSFASPVNTAKPPTVFGTSTSTTTPAAPTFSFVAPTTQPKAEVKEEPAEEEDDEKSPEEYEPDVHFTPVIPLPELVVAKTGEEDEIVLFEERCKMYRYTNKEWKERATGTVKVLKMEATGKHRVVMRRDQVHKVAANFPLVDGVKVTPMSTNEKAVMWVCMDFSEDEKDGVAEKLSARFATPIKAAEFMNTINDIVAAAPKSGATPKKAEPVKKEEAKKVEPVKTEEPKKTEEKKEAAAPAATTSGWGDKFKLASGEWECPSCYSRSGADVTTCPCCGDTKPGCAPEPAKNANPFGKNATLFNPSASASSSGTPKFSFGVAPSATTPAAPSPAVTAAPKEADKKEIVIPSNTAPASSTTTGGFKFGSMTSALPSTTTAPVAPTTTAAPKFSFMAAAATASKEAENKEKTSLFGTTPAASTSAFGGGITSGAPASPATFSFKTAASSSSTSTAVPTTGSMPSFSFKTPDPSKPSSIFGGSQKTLFGASSPSVTTPATEKKEEENKETPTTVFGSSFMKGAGTASSVFGGLGAGKPSIFDQKEKIEEGQKNFSNLQKSKPFGAPSSSSATTTATGDDGEGDNENPEEYEPEVEFAPVIPLPDLVEVKTGEEDETVVFNTRAKIFRFVRGTDAGEFKERGVGDMKILHNPSTGKYRVVMRREQVHKICANFPILPGCDLHEKSANARTILVKDFADTMEGSMETLAIKFKNADAAKEFDTAFKKAQDAQKQ